MESIKVARIMPSSEFEQSVRRAQLISPWGIGAIVPFPKNRSMMVAGLDMWDYGNDRDSYRIDDERLARYIGVRDLLEPPADKNDGKLTGMSVPAVKFPLWHYCPRCGHMERLKPGSNDRWCKGTENHRPHSPKRMIPERFVAICPHGHIEDFPVSAWLHEGESLDPNCRHGITRSTFGSSTSLTAVKYSCTCGARRSMMGATHDGALTNINVYCSGSRPWLGDHATCDQELKVVQVGGSNVWFSIVKSSIWIPPTGGNIELQKKIQQYLQLIGAIPTDSDGNLDSATMDALAERWEIPVGVLEKEYRIYLATIEQSGIDESMSEEDYRFSEYEALINEDGSDRSAFSCKRISATKYENGLGNYFDGITLVRKLQETRAFIGFSRVQPDDRTKPSETLKELSTGRLSWAPAVKVFGEGIFFQFDAIRLQKWTERPEVIRRVSWMTRSFNTAADRWNKEHTTIRPEYVLLHTFAHMIINRLIFDCGYGSSSIRERIYCDFSSDVENSHDMAGVLIYTASGDSEGSLGGLVRMGEPGRLEGVVWRALEDALWCSSDPVCSQSHGQGPDSCNLAACHDCALLPETCCERGNRILDRIVVVGGEECPGYFDVQ